MLLEQEIASIMRFVLEHAGDPKPYYDEVPEGFVVPSVFFPVPEMTTGGDTMSTYEVEYSWFVKFFHSSTPGAHQMATAVLTAIMARRNLIPLVDVDGNAAGKGIRLRDPSLRPIDSATGVVQLQLMWPSYRAYTTAEMQQMIECGINMHTKGRSK